jgi:hypothetical protein
VSYNARGLRGRELTASPAPGTLRLAVLGDSFVEGKQVGDDEVFTARLESLATAAGRRLEVVNAGVGGYGTGDELLLWERAIAPMGPSVVLVGFFANDVRNNVDRALFDCRRRLLRSRSRRAPGALAVRSESWWRSHLVSREERRARAAPTPSESPARSGRRGGLALDPSPRIHAAAPARRVAARTGSELIDLLDAFREANRASGLLRGRRPLNAAGHRLAAEILRSSLARASHASAPAPPERRRQAEHAARSAASSPPVAANAPT